MGRRGLVFGVAVIEGFEVGWSRVVGGPPDALFQAGSISKPVAALAAAAARLPAWRPRPVAQRLTQSGNKF